MNDQAPLLDAIAAYAGRGRLGYHMPGHQKGNGLAPAFSRLLAEYGAALDLTELPGLDNLAAPDGCIGRSQEAMARLAGSAYVYYLVNGASAGLEAVALAMSGPDVPTILPANCHTAIQQGLILSGSMPVILPCLADLQWGLPLGTDREAAEVWLKRDNGDGDGRLPDEALWISVNPTYNGLLADLGWEKRILESRPGWGWAVDEAHGAHLPYGNVISSDEKPYSALHWDADVVVQSAHKMGTGFTQTGIMHCNRPALAGKLRQAVNIMQSSSPSYLLMASLDAWLAYLEDGGVQKLRRTSALARELAGRIRAIGDYRLWQDELPDDCVVDPRKITLSSRELGLDGFALADALRKEYEIDVELATGEYALLIVNPTHSREDIDRTVDALMKIRDKRRNARPGLAGDGRERAAGAGQNGSVSDELRSIWADLYRPGQKPWRPAIPPREAFFAEQEKVEIERSRGRLAAASVVPYPPGIPLTCPGMEIRQETAGAIEAILKTGQRCAGLEYIDGRWYISVVK